MAFIAGAVEYTRRHTIQVVRAYRLELWLRNEPAPCLLWLSGLSAGHEPKGPRFDFPSGGVVGQVPIWGHARGNQFMFLSLSPSLPLSLKKKLKSFFKKKTGLDHRAILLLGHMLAPGFSTVLLSYNWCYIRICNICICIYVHRCCICLYRHTHI